MGRCIPERSIEVCRSSTRTGRERGPPRGINLERHNQSGALHMSIHIGAHPSNLILTALSHHPGLRKNLEKLDVDVAFH
jgi:hypothetical protein